MIETNRSGPASSFSVAFLWSHLREFMAVDAFIANCYTLDIELFSSSGQSVIVSEPGKKTGEK